MLCIIDDFHCLKFRKYQIAKVKSGFLSSNKFYIKKVLYKNLANPYASRIKLLLAVVLLVRQQDWPMWTSMAAAALSVSGSEMSRILSPFSSSTPRYSLHTAWKRSKKHRGDTTHAQLYQIHKIKDRTEYPNIQKSAAYSNLKFIFEYFHSHS